MVRSSVIAVLEDKSRMQGLSDKVAELIREEPALFPELMFGLWHVESYVRERAADAIEKITREQPEQLQPFKAELIGLMEQARPASVRWHLAQMVPRLKLLKKERAKVVEILRGYLTDRSSIVKTFAMDSLAEVCSIEPTLRADVVEMIREYGKVGTPAMQARARILLREMESA